MWIDVGPPFQGGRTSALKGRTYTRLRLRKRRRARAKSGEGCACGAECTAGRERKDRKADIAGGALGREAGRAGPRQQFGGGTVGAVAAGEIRRRRAPVRVQRRGRRPFKLPGAVVQPDPDDRPRYGADDDNVEIAIVVDVAQRDAERVL